MSLVSPLKSTLFAYGSEFYELSDEYDSSVTGGGSISAWSGDYEYFGYVNCNGKWIIQRHQISTGQYRYINGSSNYSANWTLAIAGSLSYDYYYKMSNTSP